MELCIASKDKTLSSKLSHKFYYSGMKLVSISFLKLFLSLTQQTELIIRVVMPQWWRLKNWNSIDLFVKNEVKCYETETILSSLVSVITLKANISRDVSSVKRFLKQGNSEVIFYCSPKY